jgi:hypothetical protein
MKYRKYKKGVHTYTKYGNAKEVSHETPVKTVYDFDDDCREIFAADFHTSTKDSRFSMRFYPVSGSRSGPGDLKIFSDLHTVRRLIADLKTSLG